MWRNVANWCTDMQIHLPAANYHVLIRWIMFKSLADPEYHFCQIIPRDTTTQEAGAVMKALAFHQSVPRSFSDSTPLWDKLRFPTLLRQFFFWLLKLRRNKTTTAQKKDHFPYPCSILFAFKIFASWLRCLRLTVISSVWLGSSIRIWASAYINDTWIQERKSWYREKQAFNPWNDTN